MKKTIFLIAVIIATSFASCKKAYKCECSTSETSSSTNGVPNTVSDAVSVNTREISKSSKKSATAQCGNSTDVTTSSFQDFGTTYVTTSNSSTTCSLK
jgi:hypothetical protein